MIFNFGTEMKTKLESFIKDDIYDPETGEILGFKIPSIADLKLPEFPDIGEKISGFVDELGKFICRSHSFKRRFIRNWLLQQ
jgi:hypothetical protein